MKDIFDFRRFIHVMWYTWVTQPLVPYFIMLAAAPLMYSFFSVVIQNGIPGFYSMDTALAFCFYFPICGWLYAGMIFQEYGKRTSACVYIHIPASQLEKWLAKALLAFIVFPVFLILFFKLALYGFDLISAPLFAFRFPPFNWSAEEVQVIIFIFYMILPAAFTISLLWRRFGIIKGIMLSFALMMLLLNLTNWGLAGMRLDTSATVLLNVIDPPFLEQGCTGDACRLVWWFWILSTYAPALLFLLSSWFLMKSKEI